MIYIKPEFKTARKNKVLSKYSKARAPCCAAPYERLDERACYLQRDTYIMKHDFSLSIDDSTKFLMTALFCLHVASVITETDAKRR